MLLGASLRGQQRQGGAAVPGAGGGEPAAAAAVAAAVGPAAAGGTAAAERSGLFLHLVSADCWLVGWARRASKWERSGWLGSPGGLGLKVGEPPGSFQLWPSAGRQPATSQPPPGSQLATTQSQPSIGLHPSHGTTPHQPSAAPQRSLHQPGTQPPPWQAASLCPARHPATTLAGSQPPPMGPHFNRWLDHT